MYDFGRGHVFKVNGSHESKFVEQSEIFDENILRTCGFFLEPLDYALFNLVAINA